MKKTLITPPAAQAIDLDVLKQFLRMDADLYTVHADTITALITACTGHAEDMTGRAMITQTWDLTFDSWSDVLFEDGGYGPERVLPFGWCQEAAHIKYLDPDQTEVTLDTDQWAAAGIGADDGAQIYFPGDGGFDSPALYEKEAVTLRMVCGYGDTHAAVPAPVRTAIMVMVKDLFDGEEYGFTNYAMVPKTANVLLRPYKLWRF